MIAPTAALAAAVVLAAPAVAAPGYTVTVGKATTGSHSVTAARVTDKFLTYKFGNVYETCSNLTSTWTVTAGTGINPIATTPGLNFTGCSINGTSSTRQWNASPAFVASGTASGARESVAGSLTNINMTERWGAICTFTLVGSAAATFDETTQRLVIDERAAGGTGNLTATNLRGCGGTIASGQKVTWGATLAVTSPDGPIALS